MGWEERGGRHYYYRKERIGERIVSRYAGSGPVARLIAQQDRRERRQQNEERQAREQERKALRQQRDVLREAQRAVHVLQGVVLLSCGYHTHRGQWRKSRNIPTTMTDVTTEVNGRRKVFRLDLPEEMDFNAVKELFERVSKEKPKPADVQAFREVLCKYPDLWRVAGDMVEFAKDELLRSVGATAGMQESMRMGMEELAREMGYAESPLLERLLIEQVVMTWLHLYKMQYSYHQITSGSHSHAQGRYWEQRLSAAQQRHLRAVESLARVRKLASRHPLQINIAGQQINVAGSPSAEQVQTP